MEEAPHLFLPYDRGVGSCYKLLFLGGLLFSSFFGVSYSLSESELISFGRNHGDQSLPKDVEDVSSREVELEVPIKFFGREYGSIFVNENGLLSFLTEIPVFFNLQFPMEYPLIAALYSDVDTRDPNAGNVWYRKTHERGVMDTIGERISDKFKVQFLPREAFIATWDHVGSFDLQSAELNTYQIVIASDERDSYVLLHYPENGIQWIKGKGKTQGMPDAKAQVGIISGEGQYVELPFSGMDQVRHLTEWSNVNERGVFMYKTGQLEPSMPAGLPNELEYNRFSPDNFRTCSEGGSSTCHLFAQCNDFGPSFCCECNPNYVGNGQTCIQLGTPQRVIGTVSLNVNSVDLRDQVLHCYIVTEEGRSYTAFSRIDSSIGYDLQSLSVIGTPAGWLFAQSMNGAPNGITYTGGSFNYTAKVTFPNTNHVATVKFIFKGLDVFDYINADVHVEGSLPKLGPKGVKVNIEDFDEKFTKERTGLFTSKSKRKIILEDGSLQKIPMHVEQEIHFEECDGNSRMREIQLHSGRNFVVFDEEEGIVRFALTNKVSPFEAQGDSACMDMDCGKGGACEVQESIPVCICSHGFELQENQCVDINECLRDGMSNCSPYADCMNDAGSYGCLCKPGYLGNGQSCYPDTTCEELICHPNAECTDNEFGIPSCICLNGFNGNGTYCYSVPSEVELRGYASPETIALNLQDGSRDINVLEDLGPPVNHYYEVLNHGPYSIGDLQLRITWPLKDLNDRYILYIPSAPFVKYSNQGDDFIEECQVDSSIVNPEGYVSVKRVKRQDQSIYDYNDEDLLLRYEKDYAELEDYDYSHFDRYNKDPYILTPPNNEKGFQDYEGSDYNQYGYPVDERNELGKSEDSRNYYSNMNSGTHNVHPFAKESHSTNTRTDDNHATDNTEGVYNPRNDPRYTYSQSGSQHQGGDNVYSDYDNSHDPRYTYDQNRYGNEHQQGNHPRTHDQTGQNYDQVDERNFKQDPRYYNNQHSDMGTDHQEQKQDHSSLRTEGSDHQDPRYTGQTHHQSNDPNYRERQDPRYVHEQNHTNQEDLRGQVHDSNTNVQDPRYREHYSEYHPNTNENSVRTNVNQRPYDHQDPRQSQRHEQQNEHYGRNDGMNQNPYDHQDPRQGQSQEQQNEHYGRNDGMNQNPYDHQDTRQGQRHEQQNEHYGRNDGMQPNSYDQQDPRQDHRYDQQNEHYGRSDAMNQNQYDQQDPRQDQRYEQQNKHNGRSDGMNPSSYDQQDPRRDHIYEQQNEYYGQNRGMNKNPYDQQDPRQDQRYQQPNGNYRRNDGINSYDARDPSQSPHETQDPYSRHDPTYDRTNYQQPDSRDSYSPTGDRHMNRQRENERDSQRNSNDPMTHDPRYRTHESQPSPEEESPSRQGGPGQVSFICNINLAVNEIASLTVKSHLKLKTLKDHYPSVTQFVFPSEGEVIQSESVKSKGRNIVNLLTTGVPRVKVHPDYSICGELECHQDADCYQTFRGDEAAQCRCKPGFKGDGFRCIDSGQRDCRIDPEICHDFGRCEYDNDNEFYRCNCLDGYTGNGTHCEKMRGSCHVLNDCSPFGSCEMEGNDFVCRCLDNYEGDGYECEKIQESSTSSWEDNSVPQPDQLPPEIPTCLFDTCSCYYGYIFEGSRCIVDEQRRGLRVPIAFGYCNGNSCECPRGYKYDKHDEICKLEEIHYPSDDVFCDDNGSQCSSNAQCIYDRSYDHSLCVCNEGYIGDGFECDLSPVTVHSGNCMKDSECPLEMKCVVVVEEFNYKYTCVDIKQNNGPDKYSLSSASSTVETEVEIAPEVDHQNLCSSHLDCHAQADCIYNAEYERYQCECFQFYEGDGQYECHPSPDAGCDILENCDPKNGICSYEDDKFVCRCKAGYHGDGLTCREDVIGCNVINNCGEFATCQFDFEEGGYRCKCDEHRGFMGDGFTCNITSSCREIPSICHERARCAQNTYNNEFNCECIDGFMGDGLHCEAIPEHDGNFLFLAHGMAVIKLPFTASAASPALPTFINAQEMATGIDIDCISGKVYWTDTIGKRIRRSNYDGSAVETYLEGDMDFPVGVAIDFKSRNLYWTDSGKRTVNIVDLETKQRRVLVEQFLKNPRGIAVHPTLGALLWTDWDRQHPKIEFSNMDGSGRRTLVESNLGMPNSIAINYEEYKFCWTDGGSSFPPVNPKIECLGIHGGGSREEIISLANGENLPYGISIHNDQIYWSDWKKPNVHTINIKNLSSGPSLNHVLAGMGNPFGLVSVPEGCPYATTTCSPGSCDQNRICAPNGRGGHSCLCQDGDESQGCNSDSLY